jgi:hypothetical protein
MVSWVTRTWVTCVYLYGTCINLHVRYWHVQRPRYIYFKIFNYYICFILVFMFCTTCTTCTGYLCTHTCCMGAQRVRGTDRKEAKSGWGTVRVPPGKVKIFCSKGGGYLLFIMMFFWLAVMPVLKLVYHVLVVHTYMYH